MSLQPRRVPPHSVTPTLDKLGLGPGGSARGGRRLDGWAVLCCRIWPCVSRAWLGNNGKMELHLFLPTCHMAVEDIVGGGWCCWLRSLSRLFLVEGGRHAVTQRRRESRGGIGSGCGFPAADIIMPDRKVYREATISPSTHSEAGEHHELDRRASDIPFGSELASDLHSAWQDGISMPRSWTNGIGSPRKLRGPQTYPAGKLTETWPNMVKACLSRNLEL